MVNFKDLQTITTEDEYNSVMEYIYNLLQLDLPDDSPLLDEFERLTILVEDYDSIHYPID